MTALDEGLKDVIKRVSDLEREVASLKHNWPKKKQSQFMRQTAALR